MSINKKRKKSIQWIIFRNTLAVLDFIGVICSIGGFIYTILGDKADNIFSLTFWIIILIILFVALIILIYVNIAEKSEIKFSIAFHNILHYLRDVNVKLREEMEENNLSKEQFLERITSNSIDIMDKIAEILTEITGKKVRACLKLYDFIKNNEEQTENMKLITFARNGKKIDKAIEEQKKTIDVVENTDFEYIFNIKTVNGNGEEHFFYEKDLVKYDKDLKKITKGREYYKNSNKDWNKIYNTTIVMPLRYLRTSTLELVSYDIAGFLCVDAFEKNAFENNIIFTEEFLKGISDILYSYLNSCKEYYITLKEREKERKILNND